MAVYKTALPPADAGYRKFTLSSQRVPWADLLFPALENALIDISVGVKWLREEAGVETVVILGNSGGGSLMGAYQAEAYYAGLERTFGLLADFPRIGQPVDELRAGYRRFRFQSHFVFYTAEAGGVTIRAILHVATDIRPQLFQ